MYLIELEVFSMVWNRQEFLGTDRCGIITFWVTYISTPLPQYPYWHCFVNFPHAADLSLLFFVFFYQLAPENTLMSFQKAVEQKVYGVQADVVLR